MAQKPTHETRHDSLLSSTRMLPHQPALMDKATQLLYNGLKGYIESGI